MNWLGHLRSRFGLIVPLGLVLGATLALAMPVYLAGRSVMGGGGEVVLQGGRYTAGTTAGQVVVGPVQGGAYSGNAGFWAPERGENLFRFALLSVEDVGNDQGRRVRLRWRRHPLDRASAPQPVTGYRVYRRVGAQLVVQEGMELMPPGEWDLVTSVGSGGDPSYSLLVDTLCDSTDSGICWSTFVVRATTADPFAYFNSEPDSGYSVDNLPPPAPAALAVAYSPGGNELLWSETVVEDLRGYRVYRGGDPQFEPAEGELLGETGSLGWSDPAPDPYGFHYLVVAVDLAGNESEITRPQTVTAVDTPERLALEGPFPNPFNPSTTLRFTLPRAGRARLEVLDVAGKLVDVPFDERVEAGTRELRWHGVDRQGRAVASGTYFARLVHADGVVAQPMVLLK